MNIRNEDEVGRWIQKLIDEDNIHGFYTSGYWLKLRKEVLEENKNECKKCKEKGFYEKATHVHHVQYVRKHPRLALSKIYSYDGKEYQNLIPLCHECHEEEHDYRNINKKEKPLTEEKW